MAVKLRLMRMGKKKQPTYRIVAADSRSPRNGRFIEIVGTYQPRLEPSGVAIDNEKAIKWLRNGAQPTDTVRNLLSKQGVMLAFDLTKRGASAEDVAKAVEEHSGLHQAKADKIEAERRKAEEAARKAAAEAAKKEAEEKAAAEAAAAAEAEAAAKAEEEAAEAPAEESAEG